jgi:hypothetical protein
VAIVGDAVTEMAIPRISYRQSDYQHLASAIVAAARNAPIAVS